MAYLPCARSHLGKSRHVALTAVAIAGMSIGSLTAAPALAAPAAPACGTTLTTNLVLHADMNCSRQSGAALIIGAANITIDLHGFTITGPTGNINSTGIADGVKKAGFSGLVIEDGFIKNFFNAVEVDGTSKKPLSGIKMKGVGITDITPQWSNGFYGSYLKAPTLTNNKISNENNGINIVHCSGATISGNGFTDMVTGVWDQTGSRNLMLNNKATNLQAAGIELDHTSSDTVRGNLVKAPIGDGVNLSDSAKDTIKNNNLNGNYTAVLENYGSHNVIIGNSASNDVYGIYISGSTDSIENNILNGDFIAIEADLPKQDIVSGNTTDRNSDVGIYGWENFKKNSLVISNNVSNYNEYGIFASQPANGSGNKARGNKVFNCQNVQCK